MTIFKCQYCEQVLYFENQRCEKCSHPLGFLPESCALSALTAEGDAWRALEIPGRRFRSCANVQSAACNWLIPAESPESLCVCCRHNRVIPDLSIPENIIRWRKLESAQRRLFYSLIRLNLPLANRADHPKDGLCFDFLSEMPDAPVLTGHENGVITINVKEADDAEREKLRLTMAETYRTLLGHFRHETGHYFWDRLVRDGGLLEDFRNFFGDERQNYKDALKCHYANGPVAGWQHDFISGYASTHPWEDFAETWAHYLHIFDTIEMASAFGMRMQPFPKGAANRNAALTVDPRETEDFNELIEAWIPLAIAVNAMNRCMGEPDLYPFVLTPKVIRKLGFVHHLVHGDLLHGDLVAEKLTQPADVQLEDDAGQAARHEHLVTK